MKTYAPDVEHAHRAMVLCSRAIETFRATRGDAFSILPRNRFTITMHPADASALGTIIGPDVPNHPLVYAGMVVVEDGRFEAPVVSLAADGHI